MGLISEQSHYTLAAVDPHPCSRATPPSSRIGVLEKALRPSPRRRCTSTGPEHISDSWRVRFESPGIVWRPRLFTSSVVERRLDPPAERTLGPISTRRPEVGT